jgi:hypothetical protein
MASQREGKKGKRVGGAEGGKKRRPRVCQALRR